jgi:hypothetical protein
MNDKNIILQHPVEQRGSGFAFLFLQSSLYCHYMFRPNRPSSGAQAVVIKEPATQSNAVLCLLCSCSCRGRPKPVESIKKKKRVHSN